MTGSAIERSLRASREEKEAAEESRLVHERYGSRILDDVELEWRGADLSTEESTMMNRILDPPYREPNSIFNSSSYIDDDDDDDDDDQTRSLSAIERKNLVPLHQRPGRPPPPPPPPTPLTAAASTPSTIEGIKAAGLGRGGVTTTTSSNGIAANEVDSEDEELDGIVNKLPPLMKKYVTDCNATLKSMEKDLLAQEDLPVSTVLAERRSRMAAPQPNTAELEQAANKMRKLSLEPGGRVRGWKAELRALQTTYRRKHGVPMPPDVEQQAYYIWELSRQKASAELPSYLKDTINIGKATLSKEQRKITPLALEHYVFGSNSSNGNSTTTTTSTSTTTTAPRNVGQRDEKGELITTSTVTAATPTPVPAFVYPPLPPVPVFSAASAGEPRPPSLIATSFPLSSLLGIEANPPTLQEKLQCPPPAGILALAPPPIPVSLSATNRTILKSAIARPTMMTATPKTTTTKTTTTTTAATVSRTNHKQVQKPVRHVAFAPNITADGGAAATVSALYPSMINGPRRAPQTTFARNILNAFHSGGALPSVIGSSCSNVFQTVRK